MVWWYVECAYPATKCGGKCQRNPGPLVDRGRGYEVASPWFGLARLGDLTFPDLPAETRPPFEREFWLKLMAAAPKGGE